MNKVSKGLLQVAAIGLFLNAMGAYGACDMKMHASEDSIEERVPCHGVSNEATTKVASSDVDVEDCCSACVPVAIFAGLGIVTQLAADTVGVHSTVILVSNGFDPPFRPPIAILS